MFKYIPVLIVILSYRYLHLTDAQNIAIDNCQNTDSYFKLGIIYKYSYESEIINEYIAQAQSYPASIKIKTKCAITIEQGPSNCLIRFKLSRCQFQQLTNEFDKGPVNQTLIENIGDLENFYTLIKIVNDSITDVYSHPKEDANIVNFKKSIISGLYLPKNTDNITSQLWNLDDVRGKCLTKYASNRYFSNANDSEILNMIKYPKTCENNHFLGALVKSPLSYLKMEMTVNIYVDQTVRCRYVISKPDAVLNRVNCSENYVVAIVGSNMTVRTYFNLLEQKPGTTSDWTAKWDNFIRSNIYYQATDIYVPPTTNSNLSRKAEEIIKDIVVKTVVESELDDIGELFDRLLSDLRGSDLKALQDLSQKIFSDQFCQLTLGSICPKNGKNIKSTYLDGLTQCATNNCVGELVRLVKSKEIMQKEQIDLIAEKIGLITSPDLITLEYIMDLSNNIINKNLLYALGSSMDYYYLSYEKKQNQATLSDALNKAYTILSKYIEQDCSLNTPLYDNLITQQEKVLLQLSALKGILNTGDVLKKVDSALVEKLKRCALNDKNSYLIKIAAVETLHHAPNSESLTQTVKTILQNTSLPNAMRWAAFLQLVSSPETAGIAMKVWYSEEEGSQLNTLISSYIKIILGVKEPFYEDFKLSLQMHLADLPEIPDMSSKHYLTHSQAYLKSIPFHSPFIGPLSMHLFTHVIFEKESYAPQYIITYFILQYDAKFYPIFEVGVAGAGPILEKALLALSGKNKPEEDYSFNIFDLYSAFSKPVDALRSYIAKNFPDLPNLSTEHLESIFTSSMSDPTIKNSLNKIHTDFRRIIEKDDNEKNPAIMFFKVLGKEFDHVDLLKGMKCLLDNKKVEPFSKFIETDINVLRLIKHIELNTALPTYSGFTHHLSVNSAMTVFINKFKSGQLDQITDPIKLALHRSLTLSIDAQSTVIGPKTALGLQRFLKFSSDVNLAPEIYSKNGNFSIKISAPSKPISLIKYKKKLYLIKQGQVINGPVHPYTDKNCLSMSNFLSFNYCIREESNQMEYAYNSKYNSLSGNPLEFEVSFEPLDEKQHFLRLSGETIFTGNNNAKDQNNLSNRLNKNYLLESKFEYSVDDSPKLSYKFSNNQSTKFLKLTVYNENTFDLNIICSNDGNNTKGTGELTINEAIIKINYESYERENSLEALNGSKVALVRRPIKFQNKLLNISHDGAWVGFLLKNLQTSDSRNDSLTLLLHCPSLWWCRSIHNENASSDDIEKYVFSHSVFFTQDLDITMVERDFKFESELNYNSTIKFKSSFSKGLYDLQSYGSLNAGSEEQKYGYSLSYNNLYRPVLETQEETGLKIWKYVDYHNLSVNLNDLMQINGLILNKKSNQSLEGLYKMIAICSFLDDPLKYEFKYNLSKKSQKEYEETDDIKPKLSYLGEASFILSPPNIGYVAKFDLNLKTNDSFNLKYEGKGIPVVEFVNNNDLFGKSFVKIEMDSFLLNYQIMHTSQYFNMRFIGNSSMTEKSGSPEIKLEQDWYCQPNIFQLPSSSYKDLIIYKFNKLSGNASFVGNFLDYNSEYYLQIPDGRRLRFSLNSETNVTAKSPFEEKIMEKGYFTNRKGKYVKDSSSQGIFDIDINLVNEDKMLNFDLVYYPKDYPGKNIKAARLSFNLFSPRGIKFEYFENSEYSYLVKVYEKILLNKLSEHLTRYKDEITQNFSMGLQSMAYINQAYHMTYIALIYVQYGFMALNSYATSKKIKSDRPIYGIFGDPNEINEIIKLASTGTKKLFGIDPHFLGSCYSMYQHFQFKDFDEEFNGDNSVSSNCKSYPYQRNFFRKIITHPFEWNNFSTFPILTEVKIDRFFIYQFDLLEKTSMTKVINGPKFSYRNAIIFGNGYYVTFDGLHDKYPICGNDEKLYLLASDYKNNTFALLGSLDKLTLITPSHNITIIINNARIDSYNTFLDGQALPNLPYHDEKNGISVFVNLDYFIKVKIPGLRFGCYSTQNLCYIKISHIYHGKIVGLLGNNNLEAEDDDSYVPSVDTFQGYFNIDPKGSQSCKKNSPDSGNDLSKTFGEQRMYCKMLNNYYDNRNEWSREDIETMRETSKDKLCNDLYPFESDSRYSDCFSTLDPSPYYQACLFEHVKEQCSNQIASKKNLCPALNAYVTMCGAKYIHLERNPACVLYEGKYLEDIWKPQQLESPNKSIQIVLLVNPEKEINYTDHTLALQNLLKMLGERLHQEGYNDVKFGIVTYKTFLGKPYIVTLAYNLNTLSADIPKTTPLLNFANLETTTCNCKLLYRSLEDYIFDPSAIKIFISITPQDEFLYNEAEFNNIKVKLWENGVTYNVISRYPENLNEDSHYGLDYNNNYLNTKIQTKNPNPLSLRKLAGLAFSTKGAIFDYEKFYNTKNSKKSQEFSSTLVETILRQTQQQKEACNVCQLSEHPYGQLFPKCPYYEHCDTKIEIKN